MDANLISKILNSKGYHLIGSFKTPYIGLDKIQHLKAKKNDSLFFGSIQKSPAQDLKHRFFWQNHFYQHQKIFKNLFIPHPVELITAQGLTITLQEYLPFENPPKKVDVAKGVKISLEVAENLRQTPIPEKPSLKIYRFPYKWQEKFKPTTPFEEAVHQLQAELKKQAKPSTTKKVCLHGDLNPDLWNSPLANGKRYCLDFEKSSVADQCLDYAILLVYSQFYLAWYKASEKIKESVEGKILVASKNPQPVWIWSISIHASKILTIQGYKHHPDPNYRQKRGLIHLDQIKKGALKTGVKLNTKPLEKLIKK